MVKEEQWNSDIDAQVIGTGCPMMKKSICQLVPTPFAFPIRMAFVADSVRAGMKSTLITYWPLRAVSSANETVEPLLWPGNNVHLQQCPFNL